MIVVTDAWVDPDGEAFVRVAEGDGWLSPRDQRVLRQVANGWTNAEIGRRLSLSESVVKACVSRLLRHFRARDRAQAVHVAWRRGLLR